MVKPPGTKRLSVALSAVAYILIGIPVWWHTTSLHRPPLPHEDIAAAAEDARHRSPLLPVTLQLVIAVPAGVEWPSELSAAAFAQSVQEAVSSHPWVEATVTVSALVNTGGECSRSGKSEAQESCIDLTGAPVSPSPSSSSSSTLQQQRQLDEWLHSGLQQGADKSAAATPAAGGVPGVYRVVLLPAVPGADDEATAGDSGSISSTPSRTSTAQLTVGRHRHAWLTYNPEQAAQHPQLLLQQANSAILQALTCCFGLHGSKAAITAAESLPVSAAGHTQLGFALLNADPSLGEWYSWDFDHFEHRYMSKVAASLSPVCQVSMTSQVLQYTPARSEGRWSRKHNAYVVKHSQLPFFIDSEWAVESSGSGELGQYDTASGTVTSRQYNRTAPRVAQLHSQSSGQDQSAVPEPHVLHFLVYVPAASRRPLLLLSRKGTLQDSNSFWIPSWGGLVVMNPYETAAHSGRRHLQQSPDQPTTVDEADNSSNNAEQRQLECSSSSSWRPAAQLDDAQYKHIASVVIAQLQALFGVAPGNNSDALTAARSRGAGISVQQLPAGVAGFTAWQVDALLRQRVGFDVLEASRVLASLSKLVQELPNLEMPDLIGQQVEEALQDITLAWQYIAAGDYHAAATSAAAARAAAEAAFLHPAVLAQLNFPESHKLGVYMPLFLPISVPLVQGLLGQISRYVSRRRSCRAATVTL